MRRSYFLFVALSLACGVHADRLITIPEGRKIPFDTFKFDSFIEISSGRSWDRFVGFGITPDFEVDYHGEKIDRGPMRDTFDFSYNYLAPIINQSPGISVGMEDVLNRTTEGRRAYLAATWRQSVDNVGHGNLPLEATLGVSQGSRALPFVGVSLPFSENIRFQVEDDGIRIATALEYRAMKNAFSARVVFRDQDFMVGATLNLHF